MLKPKSNDISLKRTGMHILSAPTTEPYVSIANANIYHLEFDLFVSVIEKNALSHQRLKENVKGVKV
jgi:hypothetical protein